MAHSEIAVLFFAVKSWCGFVFYENAWQKTVGDWIWICFIPASTRWEHHSLMCPTVCKNQKTEVFYLKTSSVQNFNHIYLLLWTLQDQFMDGYIFGIVVVVVSDYSLSRPVWTRSWHPDQNSIARRVCAIVADFYQNHSETCWQILTCDHDDAVVSSDGRVVQELVHEKDQPVAPIHMVNPCLWINE